MLTTRGVTKQFLVWIVGTSIMVPGGHNSDGGLWFRSTGWQQQRERGHNAGSDPTRRSNPNGTIARCSEQDLVSSATSLAWPHTKSYYHSHYRSLRVLHLLGSPMQIAAIDRGNVRPPNDARVHVPFSSGKKKFYKACFLHSSG